MDTGNVTSIDANLRQKRLSCPACINLQEQFGRQYKISYDPAYNPKHVPRDKLDPWMMQIRATETESGGHHMRFKKGDLLTTKYARVTKPLARVEKVTRAGVVHCVNLVECATMKEGEAFQFIPSERTRYSLHTRK